VPTLRNIARTAPYSHSGAFTDLRGAVEFYNKGEATRCRRHAPLPALAHLGSALTDTEVDRIVDFLGALTDETFLPQTPARVPSGLASTKRGEDDEEDHPGLLAAAWCSAPACVYRPRQQAATW
jgi:cytochrome c peroxidase